MAMEVARGVERGRRDVNIQVNRTDDTERVSASVGTPKVKGSSPEKTSFTEALGALAGYSF